MSEITIEHVMATNPCEEYSRAVVEELFAKYGPFTSWKHLVIVELNAGCPVPLEDILLTAYRAATREQRMAALQHTTKLRVKSQALRYPNPPAAVAEVRRRLLEWADGGSEDIADIEQSAYDAFVITAPTYDYAVFYTATAAAAAAADDGDVAIYAYTDSNETIWGSLLYLCSLLDKASAYRLLTKGDGMDSSMIENKNECSFAIVVARALARQVRTVPVTDTDIMDRCVVVIDAALGQYDCIKPRSSLRFLIIGEGAMPDFVDPQHITDVRFSEVGDRYITDVWKEDHDRLAQAVNDLALWLRGGAGWFVMADGQITDSSSSNSNEKVAGADK